MKKILFVIMLMCAGLSNTYSASIYDEINKIKASGNPYDTGMNDQLGTVENLFSKGRAAPGWGKTPTQIGDKVSPDFGSSKYDKTITVTEALNMTGQDLQNYRNKRAQAEYAPYLIIGMVVLVFVFYLIRSISLTEDKYKEKAKDSGGKHYYLEENNNQSKPFTLEQLKYKGLTNEGLIWTEGMDDWKMLKDIPELSHQLIKPKPASVPPPIPSQCLNTGDMEQRGKKFKGYRDNASLINTFKQKIEKEFNNGIIEFTKEVNSDNPLIMGLSVQAAIAHTSQALKEADFSEFQMMSGISKQESDAIIDEVTKKMLHKCLEGY